MKIGTFCFVTRRGLGYLAKSFVEHGVITDPLVVLHDAVPNERWYPEAPVTRIDRVNTDLLRDFVAGKDAMLFFETPIWWPILAYCKKLGVRTYVVTMHECTPAVPPVQPTRWICPSLLDVDLFAHMDAPHVYLPLPVEYTWSKRGIARHFVHNGGYLGHHGREGTTLLIEAMQRVECPLQLTIRVQEDVDAKHKAMALEDHRIDYCLGNFPHEDLYADGEVAVMPQRYNGCSVPIQEALASGMAVMSTNRYPMNTWLPKAPLFDPALYNRVRIAPHLMAYEEAVIDPKVIAEKMDEFYGRDVGELSEEGRRIASEYSWAALKDRWLEVLTS